LTRNNGITEPQIFSIIDGASSLVFGVRTLDGLVACGLISSTGLPLKNSVTQECIRPTELNFYYVYTKLVN